MRNKQGLIDTKIHRTWRCIRSLLGPALFAAFICLPNVASATEPSDSPAEPAETPTLWIIGDSTVRNGNGDGVGWGEVIAEHFDTGRIHIQNRAIGGRSSRTYRTEGRWEKVLEVARPGDFVLMQFGHNDGIAPDDPKRPRGSLPGIGDETREIIHPQTHEPEVVYTYGWYMRQYVREAKQHGMIPIVCSYVPRAPRKGQTLDPALSGYGLWARQVAEQEDAAFIDLYGRIARDYVKLEAEAPHSVKERFFVGGDRDYTHTVRAGAERNALHVVAGIKDLEGDAGELASCLVDVTEPEKPRRGANR